MRAEPPTGVFLVRAWWQEGQFLARVTACRDIASDGPPEPLLLTDPKEVRWRLEEWLDEFVRAGGDG